jgi:integrase
VKWQLLTRNPTDAVEPPRPEKPEMRALTPPEIQALLVAAEPTDFYHAVFVALSTGLRLGELLALRWRDVDTEHAALQVVRSLQYVTGKGLTFAQAKTHRSHRSVSLSKETIAVLSDLRKRQVENRLVIGPAYQDGDLVFADAIGAPIPPYKLSHQFRDLAIAAGLAPLRFHDLRHSHATLLLRAGVHVKLVSQRLGHAGVAITLDTYSHVQPDMQAEAANLIDDYLVGAK